MKCTGINMLQYIDELSNKKTITYSMLVEWTYTPQCLRVVCRKMLQKKTYKSISSGDLQGKEWMWKYSCSVWNTYKNVLF